MIIWNERHNNKAAMTFKRADQSSRGRSNPCVSGGALQDSRSRKGEREHHPSIRTNKAPFFSFSLSALPALIPPSTGFTYRTSAVPFAALRPPVFFIREKNKTKASREKRKSLICSLFFPPLICRDYSATTDDKRWEYLQHKTGSHSVCSENKEF